MHSKFNEPLKCLLQAYTPVMDASPFPTIFASVGSPHRHRHRGCLMSVVCTTASLSLNVCFVAHADARKRIFGMTSFLCFASSAIRCDSFFFQTRRRVPMMFPCQTTSSLFIHTDPPGMSASTALHYSILPVFRA